MKDYLPAATPIAAVIVSSVVLYVSYHFNQITTANTVASTLSAIISALGNTAGLDDPHAEVIAMQIAVKGDEALPALKMALGARSPQLRNGAVLVVKQMYLGMDPVERSKLATTMIAYYREPQLRRGVADWAATVADQISQSDGMAVFLALQATFGRSAENCETQKPDLALAAATFVRGWTSTEPISFAIGLAGCGTTDELLGARRTALTALNEKWFSLHEPERATLSDALRKQWWLKLSEAERRRVTKMLTELNETPDDIRLSIDVVLQQLNASSGKE